MGSSPGRLSADPGRRQSPCLSTQPPGVQGPGCEGQPWAALAAHPASHHCSHSGKKAAVMPCPSDGAAGKPCSGAHPPPLHQREIPEAVGCASFRRSLQELLCIALHTVTYCVKGCEDFSSTELSASSHSTLPLTFLCLAALPSVPAGSALSPAALCRGAAPGQSCLSAALPACHELPPSQEPSTAQQHRTSPRQHFLCPLGASSRCPCGSRGTCCETR